MCVRLTCIISYLFVIVVVIISFTRYDLIFKPAQQGRPVPCIEEDSTESLDNLVGERGESSRLAELIESQRRQPPVRLIDVRRTYRACQHVVRTSNDW